MADSRGPARPADCQDCREAHEFDGEPPPCAGCQFGPLELWADNVLPARLWRTLDGQRGFQVVAMQTGARIVPEKISLSEAGLLVDRHGGGNRDLEMILLIERTVYPALLDRVIDGG